MQERRELLAKTMIDQEQRDFYYQEKDPNWRDSTIAIISPNNVDTATESELHE